MFDQHEVQREEPAARRRSVRPSRFSNDALLLELAAEASRWRKADRERQRQQGADARGSARRAPRPGSRPPPSTPPGRRLEALTTARPCREDDGDHPPAHREEGHELDHRSRRDREHEPVLVLLSRRRWRVADRPHGEKKGERHPPRRKRMVAEDREARVGARRPSSRSGGEEDVEARRETRLELGGRDGRAASRPLCDQARRSPPRAPTCR